MSGNRPAGDIELHINELVLHGFPQGEKHRIGEAVRQELLRQFSERGISDALTRQGNVSSLNAGPIQAGQGSKPEQIGTQVAQVVYGSMAGEQQRGNGTRSLNPGQTNSMHNSGLIKR
jgi:hypothetical protein